MKYQSNQQKKVALSIERTEVTPLIGMGWMKTFKLPIGKIQFPRTINQKRENHEEISPLI